MKNWWFSIFLFLGLASLPASAQTKKPGYSVSPRDTNLLVRNDDPISAALDSLSNLKMFQASRYLSDFARNNPNIPVSDSVNPFFEHSVYAERIARLDAISPFKFLYNDIVRGYIEMYATRKRNLVSRMIGLSQLYFPLFEETLAKHKMPLELKYLAIVESALNPNARSPAGATGLWQFMYGTGKMFNLEVNSYIDDRSDPIKATEAACLYMKYLYGIYKDWSLVLAAYNSGPGNVNKAIRRSGGATDYWSLRPFLPRETAGYVPAFIAASYVMHYAKEHKLYPIPPRKTFMDVDTVHVHQRVSFAQIATVLDMNVDDINYLNPSYLLGIIPYTNKYQVLTLPREKISVFVNNEQTLYNYRPNESILDSLKMIKNAISLEKKVHVVRRGESLSSIARKYRVTLNELKRWNNLKKNVVPVGTRLIVNSAYKTQEKPATPASKEIKTDANAQEKSTTEVKAPEPKEFSNYKVRAGDSVWKIAVSHGMTTQELVKLNNIKGNKVNVGQLLKVKSK